MEIHSSVRRHGVTDADIEHTIEHALAVGDVDGKVLYLGPDRAGNLLEIVSILRDKETELVIHKETELVIHATSMRRLYEVLLPETGGDDD